tara:strand:- start:185 stop:448 length:264 start_codon:yes stop_codon:yes gene_type:complete
MGKSIREVDNILDKKLIKERISEIEVSRIFGLAANETEISYLEEILHIITSFGYANLFPGVFKEKEGYKKIDWIIFLKNINLILKKK